MIRASRIAQWSGALCLVAASWTVCQADVTVSRVTTMDGMGGLLKSSTTSTESYSGDKMVNDSETKMENKMLKMFGGGKPIKTTVITRLDKELIWNIDHKDKKYTEMTFAKMRAWMDSLGGMMSGATANPMTQQQPAIDTSEITFSEPTFDVKRTGNTETISGYSCDQTIMTVTTVGTNRKTCETMTMDVSMDMMLAQGVPGAEEIVDFGVRTARAMGFETDNGSARSMTKMLEMYGIDSERLVEESKKLEGFAMKTVVSLTIGGDAMEQAKAESGGAEAEPDDEEKAKEDEGTPTDASSAAAKALGGLFGKKNKDKDEEKAKDEGAAAMPAGTMLWMSSVVTWLESTSRPASSYEIPEGYKLEKSALQED